MYSITISSPSEMQRVFLVKLMQPNIGAKIDLAPGELLVSEGASSDELVVEVENLLLRDFIHDSLLRLEPHIELRLSKGNKGD